MLVEVLAVSHPHQGGEDVECGEGDGDDEMQVSKGKVSSGANPKSSTSSMV